MSKPVLDVMRDAGEQFSSYRLVGASEELREAREAVRELVEACDELEGTRMEYPVAKRIGDALRRVKGEA